MNVPEKDGSGRRGRGRPRAFDTDETLDKAIEAFWDKGYDGASISDLVAATGLQRASLYAAFTDKEQLYLAALAHYAARVRAVFEGAFTPGRDVGAALEDCLRGMIGIYAGGNGRRGCLVSCTAPAAAGDSAAIRDMLAEVLAEIETSLADAFRAAQVPEPGLSAALAAALVQGAALRIRAGVPRAEVEATAIAAVPRLLGR